MFLPREHRQHKHLALGRVATEGNTLTPESGCETQDLYEPWTVQIGPSTTGFRSRRPISEPRGWESITPEPICPACRLPQPASPATTTPRNTRGSLACS